MTRLAFVVLISMLVMSAPGGWTQQAVAKSPPPIRTGPLRLEKMNYSKADGSCKGNPCVEIKIDSLRVISAPSVQAGERINAAIDTWVRHGEDSQPPARNPQEVLQRFVDSYWKASREESKADQAYAIPWYQNRIVGLEFQSEHVLSLSFQEGGFTGGAHPYGELTYMNFRPATGARIHMADIFKEGYIKPLNAVAERRFRELKQISPQARLGVAYPAFADGFRLNQNFSIGGRGLTFFFNDYEIAAYVEGPTRLFVPYAEIRSLLRPDANIP